MSDSSSFHIPLTLRTTGKICSPCPNPVQGLTDKRARLQYGIAQQPRLQQNLPGSLVDLLRTALNSHRYALELNQANADLLL